MAKSTTKLNDKTVLVNDKTKLCSLWDWILSSSVDFLNAETKNKKLLPLEFNTKDNKRHNKRLHFNSTILTTKTEVNL